MDSNPHAPGSSENKLWKAADDASVKYLKLLDSYEKSKTRTDLGSIPTKAEVEKAKEEKERLEFQYQLMLDMKRPKYPPIYKSGHAWPGQEDYFYGGKKRRSSTTRRMRMKKTKRAQRTRRR